MESIKKKSQVKIAQQNPQRRIYEKCLPYIYILPVFIFMFIFILKPFIFAFEKSFYIYDGMGVNEFIGLKNYYSLLFEDERFWISIMNFLYFFAWLFVCFMFPLLTSELIFNLKNKGHQEIYRSLIILPIVVPLVVTVMVWKFMYYPGIGVFSEIAKMFGQTAPNFLGEEALVKPALIFMGFPWVSGMPFLILFAALQGIDNSILEASMIEGCSTIRRVFTIDIPLIMPQIKALLVLAIIGLIQDYEKVFIVTQGGPNNASLVPGLHMYDVAFKGYSGFGYSCSMAVVLFIATFIITVFTLKNKKTD